MCSSTHPYLPDNPYNDRMGLSGGFKSLPWPVDQPILVGKTHLVVAVGAATALPDAKFRWNKVMVRPQEGRLAAQQMRAWLCIGSANRGLRYTDSSGWEWTLYMKMTMKWGYWRSKGAWMVCMTEETHKCNLMGGAELMGGQWHLWW